MTVQQLIDRVYGRLQTRLSRNLLAAAVSSASSATFAFTYALDRMQAGAKVAIDLEDCGVWSVDATAKTATVQRGDFGSTAATSHALGALVYVDPPYTPNQLLTTFNTGLASFPSQGLPAYAKVELTSAGNRTGYDMAGVTSLRRVHAVSWQGTGGDKDWIEVPSRLWTEQQKSNTTDFPSGFGLFIYDNRIVPGRTMRVIYETTYTPFAALADVVPSEPSVLGDLLVVDACWRLLGGRPADRTNIDVQGDTRRATEVSTSDQVQAARLFAQERQELLKAGQKELARKYRLGGVW